MHFAAPLYGSERPNRAAPGFRPTLSINHLVDYRLSGTWAMHWRAKDIACSRSVGALGEQGFVSEK